MMVGRSETILEESEMMVERSETILEESEMITLILFLLRKLPANEQKYSATSALSACLKARPAPGTLVAS